MEANSVFISVLIPVVCLFGLMIIAGIFIYDHIQKKKKEQLFISKGTVRVRLLYAAYGFFSTFFLTKNFIEKLHRRYGILEPGDERKVALDTIKTALLVWGLSLSAFILGGIVSRTVFMVVICGVLTYAISTTVIYTTTSQKEDRLLEQLESFILEVRHEYYVTHMVDVAIEKALLTAKQPIESHMITILDILDSPTMQEDTDEYNIAAPNRFLQMFLAACQLVMKYGDRVVDGTPLFIKNLTMIKAEIDIEINKKELLRKKFWLLGGLTVAPLVACIPIKNWAVSSFSIIEKYYTGAYGILVSVGICVLSVVIYNKINRTREMNYVDNAEHVVLKYIAALPVVSRVLTAYTEKNYGKTLKTNELLRRMGDSLTTELLYVQQFLYMVGTLLLSISIMMGIHVSSREYNFYDTSALDSAYVLLIPEQESRDEIKNYIIGIAELYKEDTTLDEAALALQIAKMGITDNESVALQMASDITKKCQDYVSNYFRWYEYILCVAVGVVGFFIPRFLLDIRKKLLEIEQENEVILFQSLILMLMHIERITPEDILAWMFRFSKIFRVSLDECISNISAGEIEALEKLKDEEPFPPFQRIVTNLIMSDRTGIEKAFDEIEADRKNFQEKRAQENKLYIEKQCSVCSMLALLPTMAVTFLYLVIPMLMASSSGMDATGLF